MRFFVDPECLAHTQAEDEIDLPEDVARHAGRALRLRAGTPVTLFCGDGREWSGPIGFDHKRTWVKIQQVQVRPTDLPFDSILVQALPGNAERMDWAVEKATEAGISEIWPVQALHSGRRLEAQAAIRKQAHWQKVAISASEQSGRTRIPRVAPVQSLTDCLATLPDSSPDDLRLFADPRAQATLFDALGEQPRRSLQIWVGPEGGWSQSETDAMRSAGLIGVRLGPRILRTETAGPLILAMACGAWKRA